MIVRAIALRYWRGLLDELQVELAEGLNVVSGPNEAGKTSIAEALYHGLLTAHTADNRTSRLWIPRGRALSPSVALEFECCGADYRVEKSFGPGSQARLYRREGGAWMPLAEGRPVQERLAQLLEEDGVLEYARGLWYLQGVSASWALDGLDDAARDRLRNALAGMLFHPEDEAVERHVEEEFRSRLQPRRLGPSAHGPLHEALERWRDARRRREEYERKQADYDAKARKLAGLRAEQARLAADEQRCRARLEQLKAERERWREYEALEGEARLASSRARQLRDIRKEWEDAARGLQNTLEQLASRQAELAAQEQAATAAEAALTDASARADELRQSGQALDAAVKYVLALLAAREADRFEKLRAPAASAPERFEMDAMRELKREVDVLRARAEQAGVRVRLQPAARLTGRIARNGDPEQPFQTAPGQPLEWHFVRSFRLELEGMGVLYAEAGSEDGRQAQRRWMETARELARRMAAWVAVGEEPGAGELEAAWKALEEQYRVAERWREQAKELEREMRKRFGYGPDEAAAQLDLARGALPGDRSLLGEALGTPWPEPDGLPAQELAALADRLRARLDDLKGGCREAETRLTRAQQQLHAIQQELQRLRGLVEGLTQAAAGDRDRLRRARAQAAWVLGSEDPDLVPEDGWSADGEWNLPLYRALAEALEKAEAQAAELEERLRAARPRGEPVGDQEVRAAEADLHTVQDSIRRCEADIHRVEGELRQLGDGLWEELQQARAEQEAARAALERECLDARALHMLRQVLASERQRRLERVLEPVRQWVVPRLGRLTGGRYRDTRLDPATLRPVGLRRDGSLEWLSCDGELSQGTSEQVAFLARLGLASLLASERRQLVVFDDPLVNTDPARQREAWGLLLEAAEFLQVLYLTCHPVPDGIEHHARVVRLHA